MTGKLTLSIDDNVITQVKKYAGKNKISLSSLTEKFYTLIVSTARQKDIDEIPISPVVSQISGLLKNSGIKDWKDERFDYLIKKYK
jgi:hypothetical protein